MNQIVGIGLNVWNGESTIIETLKSLRSQTYQKIEIVILDNKSSDNTKKKVNEFIKKDKKNKIKIKFIVDKKKRNIPDSQIFILKKYLKKFKYSMIANDDDVYMPSYVENLLKKLKKSRVNMVYSFKRKIDENGKLYNLNNFRTYGKNDSYFFNSIKFLIYREHYKISFGIYETDKYLDLMRYSKVYDKSKTNWDNVSMVYFLLNYKIDFTKKKLFYFFEKDRAKTAKRRKNETYNEFVSIFKIFVYQYNFSIQVFNIIKKNKKISIIKKILLVLVLIMSSFQKSIFYVIKFFLEKFKN